MNGVNLSVNIAGIAMKNPIMTASGTFGFGLEYGDFFNLEELGALVVKTTTLEARAGNPPPRLAETASGMLNAIGLENPGIEKVMSEELPPLAKIDVPVIVNIAGNTSTEYRELALRLDGVPGVCGLELNISCPNVKEGGLAFGTSPCMAAEVVKKVRDATGLPLIVKLTPNVTDIVTVARSVEAAGADAISLINTVLGMSIDIKTKKPRLGSIVGGLSGPAIKPIALRMVWQVSSAVSLPVIGMGGIMNADDAVEFILAGATAVSVGTANFVNPDTIPEIKRGLISYLEKNKIDKVEDLVGKLQI